ncbi:hypothetical protein C7M84_005290 [Penaeus vannamei]|uniref:Uncharacterized protein n=1 Tax=Penaeus vannamei TaxID=6689 RepID=A0A3R7PSY5_PENVA|nr:hypothetical protein C7M84_005290 [Penaeus vannamei]
MGAASCSTSCLAHSSSPLFLNSQDDADVLHRLLKDCVKARRMSSMWVPARRYVQHKRIHRPRAETLVTSSGHVEYDWMSAHYNRTSDDIVLLPFPKEINERKGIICPLGIRQSPIRCDIDWHWHLRLTCKLALAQLSSLALENIPRRHSNRVPPVTSRFSTHPAHSILDIASPAARNHSSASATGCKRGARATCVYITLSLTAAVWVSVAGPRTKRNHTLSYGLPGNQVHYPR